MPIKSIGFPGVEKLMPEYASTTIPRVISRTATRVFVFILIFCSFVSVKWLSKDPSATGDEVDEDHDNGDDQQDVDESADGVAGDQAPAAIELLKLPLLCITYYFPFNLIWNRLLFFIRIRLRHRAALDYGV